MSKYSQKCENIYLRSDDDIYFNFGIMHKFEVSNLGLELYVSSLKLGVFDEVLVSVPSRNFKQVSV